jgi:hypothetical protein
MLANGRPPEKSDNVVSKCPASETIGNDSQSVEMRANTEIGEKTVVIKNGQIVSFGNDHADSGGMFIRKRKRKLKGGHRDWRHYRSARGILVTESASYDVVKAVRINGKPRQKFILGLGSLKTPQVGTCCGVHPLIWFWHHAIRRMREHGFDEVTRLRLIEAVARGGVPRPDRTKCEEATRLWQYGCIPELFIEPSLPKAASTPHLVTTENAQCE